MKKSILFLLGLTVSLTMLAEPYYVRVNGSKDYAAANTGDQDYQGRTQYAAFNVPLKVGDKLTCYDAGGNGGQGAEWHIAVLDPYGAYEKFTMTSTTLTCNEASNYNIYIKMKWEDDMWYIEDAGGGTPVDPVDPDPSYTTSAPAQCPDVMLQGFYWDSYSNKGYGRTKWIDYLNGSNGTSAEEVGQWFDLVWLPPMSKATGGTGYLPVQYSNLDSDWGTKAKLVQLIETFHQNGARVVADIVINHVAGSTGWCSFATLNFSPYGVFSPQASWICSTDEMNSDARAGGCMGKATGAADDGYGTEANYDSGRDWDHNNAEVRNMCKAYLQWLRNVVKVDGFRYDYCKGFHNSHINDYNTAAQAYFSVMEMWDGDAGVLQSHLNDAGWNTLTFDFATKYAAFNNGIAADNYQGLRGAGLLGAGKSRYAVTFLDSHDSFQRDDNEFCGSGHSMSVCRDKILQCYAYLLSMPGVPCVFYPHWVTFKEPIKKMINARYKTGVHSESSVSDEAGSGYYKATITGKNGQIRVLIGPNSGWNSTPDGFTLAVKDTNYGVYYKINSPRGDKNTERKPVGQGIEEVTGDKVQKGDKFLQNGQLYIRCGEQVFDVMGRLVR